MMSTRDRQGGISFLVLGGMQLLLPAHLPFHLNMMSSQNTHHIPAFYHVYRLVYDTRFPEHFRYGSMEKKNGEPSSNVTTSQCHDVEVR